MRKIIVAGFAMAALSIMPAPSQAAPSAQPGVITVSGVTLVAGGCGPNGYRAANGHCYPRRPPPHYYRRRACPPEYHPTPYGCRRNY